MEELGKARHYSASTGRYWYRTVKSEEVSIEELTAAIRALEFYAAELQLSPVPRLLWVVPAEDLDAASSSYVRAFRVHRETGQPVEYPSIHTEDEFAGYTRYESKDEFFIRCGLDLPTLIHAVADEARHIWQHRNWTEEMYTEEEHDSSERDAEDYADGAVLRFGERLSAGGVNES